MKDVIIYKNSGILSKTPASISNIISRHTKYEPFDRSFDDHSVLGKLNYLESVSSPDIAYIVHQCARFFIDTKVEHGKSIRCLSRYLKLSGYR